jgi:hypothetical protein
MRTEVPKVGWWRSLFAVIVGGFFSGSVVFVLQLVLAPEIGWSEFRSGGVPGLGWPWPVDGLWSLAADLGPALVYGLLFAWGADIVLRVQPDVTAVRLSIVLIAATSALFPFGVSGAALVVLVVAVRRRAARPRRSRGWDVKGAGVALVT